jgi:leucyl-tRNA synthetase
MILLNAIEKAGGVGKNQWEVFLLLLAPFAPHTTDELWEKLGHTESIHGASWPLFDPTKAVFETAQVAVQINGKLRATITLPMSASQEAAMEAAEGEANVAKWLENTLVIKVIFVPGKIINFVVK